ncbi:ELM1/GtrOC1 family putative glycosyltransferase [Rhizosaccharibacter radicis]|uniref:Mitochondrial fission ELM1 family protein n=1 Tax=Rhizosaccharibacter radicis TaxID=2782605 RepID=A0ABT1VU01_9PROT|nr:mitochondrial fission ELM1 family protein [Acetobacteraceae bacterium KSS12]
MSGWSVMPEAPVWVVEDPGRDDAGAVAGRLGPPFRRIRIGTPLDQRVREGSRPRLVISAGPRAALWSLAMRSQSGCRTVHCAGLDMGWELSAGRDAAGNALRRLRAGALTRMFDLAVVPGAGRTLPDRAIGVVGSPHLVSPALLARARDLWAERLSHLPRFRVAVLLGGGRPDQGMELARRVSAIARHGSGCVVASVLAGCSHETADNFAAGLSGCLSLVFRHGEPGEDPTLAFLGTAHASVVAHAGARALLEACATGGPVLVSSPAGAPARLLARQLEAEGQVRPLEHGMTSWTRQPLDEAGRVARIVRGRLLASAGS